MWFSPSSRFHGRSRSKGKILEEENELLLPREAWQAQGSFSQAQSDKNVPHHEVPEGTPREKPGRQEIAETKGDGAVSS